MYPPVMQKLKSETKFKKASEIYSSCDFFEGPTNIRQIYNAKARAKQGPQDVHKATFANEVAAVEELQHSMPFLQLILRQRQKVPCIVLYTQDQLQDLKRFCCPPMSGHSTVLGIDKTFNLGTVHVTVTVFKCLAVKTKRRKDFPIFCGPMFLHGNSEREKFFFFSYTTCQEILVAVPIPQSLAVTKRYLCVRPCPWHFPRHQDWRAHII